MTPLPTLFVSHGAPDLILEENSEYRHRAPEALRNHPNEDHFLPLFAPLGAAQGTKGARIHHGINYGILSMAAFAWGL